MGGIGIENWILQNGGSFVEATKSFIEVAIDKNGETIPFEEFKKNYQLWDFGENHFSARKKSYLYDNFIENSMNETGYKTMVKTLKEYLETMEFNQNKTEGIKR